MSAEAVTGGVQAPEQQHQATNCGEQMHLQVLWVSLLKNASYLARRCSFLSEVPRAVGVSSLPPFSSQLALPTPGG